MADFSDFRVDVQEPCAASPKLEENLSYRGIQIVAPEEIICAAEDDDVAVPIAGGYHLELRALPGVPAIDRAIALVAHDVTRAKTHWGHAMDSADLVPVEPSTEDAGPGGLIEYFNVDLGAAVGMRCQPGVYFVYAFVGPFVSNVVRIMVQPPPDAR